MNEVTRREYIHSVSCDFALRSWHVFNSLYFDEENAQVSFYRSIRIDRFGYAFGLHDIFPCKHLFNLVSGAGIKPSLL